MYKEKWKNYYFPSNDGPTTNKWCLLRKVGQEQLSVPAQLKLEWIISYNTIFTGNAKKTASHFGISRKTLHKWLKRFNERNLKTLEEHSRTPKTRRVWEVSYGLHPI